MDRNLTRGRDLAMHAAIFLIAFILLFARRPDAILHAQFYAEDGAYFYSDASSTAGSCPSPANPNLTLNLIFRSISGSFTQARLIPNGLS